MEKRLALVLVLCLAWIILAQIFLTPRPPEAPPDQAGQKPFLEEPPESEKTEAPALPAEPGETPPAKGPASGMDLFDRTEGLAEERVEIETDLFRFRFNTRGAVLESIKFKKYYNDPEVLKNEELQADPSNWLEILREVRGGTPSFVIREIAEERYHLEDVFWEHEIAGNREGEKVLSFTFRAGDGLVFRKVFTLREGDHHCDFFFEVGNRNPELKQNLNLLLDAPCGITDRKRASFTIGPRGVIYKVDEAGKAAVLETVPPEDIEKVPYSWLRRGPSSQLLFAGVENNYFALLLEPIEGNMVRKVSFYPLEDTEKVEARVEEYTLRYGAPPPDHVLNEFRQQELTNVRTSLQLGLSTPEPGGAAAQRFLFFAGPKSTDLMQEPPYQPFYTLIENSYGMWPWINTSLLWILNLFHSLFNNWGVAIVFLTLVVKVLLFPLSRVQQVSMQSYSEKMKRLKPKLEEIKKKYKNNKKKFNEAQMKLMREEGVRPPLMGCLLIFLQFPIFIGLFQILRTAFELRHAPFILWVDDLSQPDALFPLGFTIPILGASTLNLLPIGMTVAFYYQQKMMPKPDTSDPQAAQMQKIMKYMPILFGLMFYNYASGLSLYWMTSNLLSIFEYRVIRKRFPVGPPVESKTKAA